MRASLARPTCPTLDRHHAFAAVETPSPQKEPMVMSPSIPSVMKAAAIDRFGGPEVLHLESLPVPVPKENEILIQLDSAGIGVWDPWVRQGELGFGPQGFPQIIGNDGAGTVVAVGTGVRRFREGDRVYAFTMRGGFYAEYVAVAEDDAATIPASMDIEEAGALGVDGITALRGLDDQLRLLTGDSVMIFGASGGIGHIAVQLAKRMGARVFAVASGADGVDLVRRLGADVAVDGRRDDVPKAARAFAPEELDAALVLVGGRRTDEALQTVKRGGRIAYPQGVEPEPRGPEGTTVLAYDGTPGAEAFDRLNRLIGSGPFHVELGRTYRLEDAAKAHRELGQHFLGKLAFKFHVS
jgi:NADPH:quinone reductase-like Zn-dependent oxidoreductase